MSGALQLKKDDVRYTYSDYEAWDTDERYELIHGVPVMMASPTVSHQRILMHLSFKLFNFLQGKPCEVFAAPLDVRLNAKTKDDIVVQPDIMVVCDKSKIENGKSVVGAPDLVIEVLSPSSRNHDFIVKQKIYLEAGVKEYWVIDAGKKSLHVFLLEENRYFVMPYYEEDAVPVTILPGCEILLKDVFEA